MADFVLGPVEAKFADLIWANEPLGSGELVKLAAGALGWKKSTTYTVLKKLCERGIMRNQDGTVSALLTRDEYYARRGEQFVSETYGGSLPAFIAAFTARNKLTDEEADAIQKLIDGARREG
jgi:predicted transcriptional regulator